MALANTAPVADDDKFTVQQGLTSTQLSGNLRVGDFDPDGDALGWAASPARLDGGRAATANVTIATLNPGQSLAFGDFLVM
jgi:hypothetical protein